MYYTEWPDIRVQHSMTRSACDSNYYTHYYTHLYVSISGGGQGGICGNVSLLLNVVHAMTIQLTLRILDCSARNVQICTRDLFVQGSFTKATCCIKMGYTQWLSNWLLRILDCSARNVQICNYSGKRYYYQVRLLCVRVRVCVCVSV